VFYLSEVVFVVDCCCCGMVSRYVVMRWCEWEYWRRSCEKEKKDDDDRRVCSLIWLCETLLAKMK
jgi:hypothetical protein